MGFDFAWDYTNFLTGGLHNASVAVGRYRFAGALAKGNQNRVNFNPVFFRELFPQGHFSFKGGFGFHITPDIHDSVDMRVNAYGWFSKGHTAHQVGGLPSNPGEF